MRISELSARTGVSASTLRFYETEGLLPAERAGNGYRVYGEGAVERLAFIAQAKHLDLPLPAVRELVTAWESEPCRSVCATYRPMLSERAAQVDQRMSSLDALRASLATAIEKLDALPDSDAPCDAECTSLDHAEPAALVATEARAPIACSLGGQDYGARVTEWRDLLASAPRVEVPGGVRVTLPSTLLTEAAALARAEQGCCTFYAFRIDLHGHAFDLTITAPTEARDLLDDLLAESEATR